MADNPHFSLPFRFERQMDGTYQVPVTEQDTLEEIGDCVELILRVEQGERGTLPGFGRPEMLRFTTDRDLARSMVQQAIDEYEPRAQASVTREDLDLNDEGVLRLLTMYGLEEVQ